MHEEFLLLMEFFFWPSFVMDEWHKEPRSSPYNDRSIHYADVQMKRFLFSQHGMNYFRRAIHESFLLKTKSLI